MAKETQEVIYEWLRSIGYTTTQPKVKRFVDKLRQVGYHKLPEGEPPLIGTHGIANVLPGIFNGSLSIVEYACKMVNYEAVAEAQRDADIRWYEGA